QQGSRSVLAGAAGWEGSQFNSGPSPLGGRGGAEPAAAGENRRRRRGRRLPGRRMQQAAPTSGRPGLLAAPLLPAGRPGLADLAAQLLQLAQQGVQPLLQVGLAGGHAWLPRALRRRVHGPLFWGTARRQLPLLRAAELFHVALHVPVAEQFLQLVGRNALLSDDLAVGRADAVSATHFAALFLPLTLAGVGLLEALFRLAEPGAQLLDLDLQHLQVGA